MENSETTINKLIDIVNNAKRGDYSGRISVRSEDLLGELSQEINDLMSTLERLTQNLQLISEGDISQHVEGQIGLAAVIKSLEADLRHFIWQAKAVADGDLSQKVLYLGELGSAFNKMTENLAKYEKSLKKRSVQLEAANKELELFSYSVSHDLRAPLRTIDGFSKVLLKEYSGKLDSEGNRLLGIIGNTTQQMRQLIDDLLSFSRLGRQAMKSSEIDMTKLAEEVFAELKTTVPERKLQLNIKPLPSAYADHTLIHEVFANLLSNAIKYTGQKETAVIEVGAETDTDENMYYVKDNGAGFDMEYADKLFGVFQRLHSTEEFEGTGVGLALVQRIISRHGGRVWAEGKVNQGATFYFTLPISKERIKKDERYGSRKLYSTKRC